MIRSRIGMWAALLALATLAGCGPRQLLSEASFAPDTISPNADGNSDVTRIRYTLGRNASVSIHLEAADGQQYAFRDSQPRSAGDYSVDFSGVIDGRLLPDADYRWIIEAIADDGQAQTAEGRLTLSGGLSTAPEITTFTIFPPVFTPNRDGISDRATLNVDLANPATLYVSLQNSMCNGSPTPPPGQPDLNCTPYPVAERPGLRELGEAGLHEFDYDAGVDLGADPPPDGTYVVTARAEDAVGQVTIVTGTLAIAGGGVPRAEIVDGAVAFSSSSVVLGETLYFTLTVENYGTVPIRTSGPPPGYVYEDLDHTFNRPGFAEESGAWRVGIGFETMESNYPFRWAVGGPQDLIVEVIDGAEYYYLPAGARAVVTGGVRVTEIPPRNPVAFFAALIHEDVEIAAINNRVDPQPVQVGRP